MKISAVIPCYNHQHRVGDVVANLLQHNISVLVVNDGSSAECTAALHVLASTSSRISLLDRPENCGKGAAVLAGLRHLHAQGYTHAIQIDADGQHNVDDVAVCIAAAQQQQQAVISAKALYDETIPKIRFYGHYLTHVCVWINTLSLRIKDSQCGFRLYPLAETIPVINTVPIGKRMDFDTDILVRLFWSGLEVQHFPTLVNYPEDGVSHFHMVMDNWRMTKMHIRLFFGMLVRFPVLIHRNIKRRRQRAALN